MVKLVWKFEKNSNGIQNMASAPSVEQVIFKKLKLLQSCCFIGNTTVSWPNVFIVSLLKLNKIFDTHKTNFLKQIS